MRETEGGAEFDEIPDGVRHIILLFQGEIVPPSPEFGGKQNKLYSSTAFFGLPPRSPSKSPGT
jgi:hypothetical protein